MSAISAPQATSGVTMSLFPSTRTDYLVMNENYPPLADRNVRRAISYAIDRKAIVKSVLFDHGQATNLVLRHQAQRFVEVLLRVDRDEVRRSNLADG